MHIDLFDTEDCDDSAAQVHVVEPAPSLVIRPLSDWLGDIARALGADLPTDKNVTIRFSDSDARSVIAGFPDSDTLGGFPRTEAAVAAPST